jgi:hypothetical protein
VFVFVGVTVTVSVLEEHKEEDKARPDCSTGTETRNLCRDGIDSHLEKDLMGVTVPQQRRKQSNPTARTPRRQRGTQRPVVQST